MREKQEEELRILWLKDIIGEDLGVVTDQEVIAYL